jgi:hypothetical protein
VGAPSVNLDQADQAESKPLPRPSLMIICPRCFRKRKVLRTSIAAKAASPEHWARVCTTCRMLRSVDEHQAAIRALYKKIEERRMRGL